MGIETPSQAPLAEESGSSHGLRCHGAPRYQLFFVFVFLKQTRVGIIRGIPRTCECEVD